MSTPFDDWLRRQQLPDAASIPTEQLALLRAMYEEASARAAKVTRWTPRARSSPADDLYAVAVRDDADVWLLTWVRRSKKNEFFMMLPRPDHSMDAHATLHADGLFHLKGAGFTDWEKQRQKPDADFKGHVQLTMTPISLAGARAVKAVCDPAHFNDVFELTPSDLAVDECAVAVDIVERGGPALAKPWSRIVKQRRHTGHVPEVLITIWESTYRAGESDESNAWT